MMGVSGDNMCKSHASVGHKVSRIFISLLLDLVLSCTLSGI